MPLLPPTRGVGRRLSGRELRPFLLDSPRFEQGASMADPAGTRPPLISLSRRPFMAAIAGGLLGAPLAARAQSAGKVYRIALIFVSSRVSDMAGPGDAAQVLHLLGDIATHPDRFDAERGETTTARHWPSPSRAACARSSPTATSASGRCSQGRASASRRASTSPPRRRCTAR